MEFYNYSEFSSWMFYLFDLKLGVLILDKSEKLPIGAFTK